MKIHFVTEPKPYWILGRWCEEWSRHIPFSTVSTVVDVEADVNIFCNYALFFPSSTKRISIFTHREKDDVGLQVAFNVVANISDWCFAQSLPTLKLLPPEKSSILRPSVGVQFHKKPLRIGVVGRDYASGRKNFGILNDLELVFGDKIMICRAIDIPYEKMPKFYSSVDYVLITATNEGGPMPVIEALAMGKPVIAPNGVGWCDEFSTIKYDGSSEDLIKVVNGLLIPEDGWEVGAKQILDVCRRLKYGNNS